MDSFILVGSGFQHVRRDQLKLVDGALARTDGRDMYLTTAVQADFYRKGISVGQPGWEHMLNDLVAQYVSRGYASDALAQQCFIELGNAERRAAASMNTAEIAFQRVREAALGFNLLAIGSTWRPKLAQSFPYWDRNWVAWCDKYIAELTRAEQSVSDFRNSVLIRHAAESMRTIREAFSTNTKPAAPVATQGGGCYVATSVYGDYDAPQVLVLRRWRDDALSRTGVGRAFISTYYAVSPHLVRAVGGRRWFSVPARVVLNRLVQSLDRPRSGRADRQSDPRTD